MKNLLGPFLLVCTLTLTLLSGLFPSFCSKAQQPAEEDSPMASAAAASSSGGNSSSTGAGTGAGTGTATGTPTVDPNMVGGTGGNGTGTDREWKGYVATDVEALRAQLPENAKYLAETFVAAGQKYNIDPLFLTSISRLETGNWTSSAFLNKGNAMGISNAGGPTAQASASSSVMRQAASLAGASGTAGHYNNMTTVGQVGGKYAPSGAVNDFNGTNSEWGVNVGRIYDGYVGALR